MRRGDPGARRPSRSLAFPGRLATLPLALPGPVQPGPARPRLWSRAEAGGVSYGRAGGRAGAAGGRVLALPARNFGYNSVDLRVRVCAPQGFVYNSCVYVIWVL